MVWERAMVGSEMGFGLVLDKMMGGINNGHPTIEANPQPPTIAEFLQNLSYTYITAKATICEQAIVFEYALPNINLNLNPHTKAVEKEMWAFCLKHGLYPGQEKGVKAAQFAFLAGLIDPTLDKKSLEAISKGYIALFGHDDDIDETRLPDPSLLERINQRFIDIANGEALRDDDLGKVKAYKLETVDFLKSQLSNKNRAEFVKTLRTYLQSTVEEARDLQEAFSSSTESVSYERYIENRRDTSGIKHAALMMLVAHGLDVERIFEKFRSLQILLDLACDIACRLNDVASAEKELLALIKHRYPDIDIKSHPELIKEVKPFITSNSVLLKYKDGCSFQKAVSLTMEEYHKKLLAFVDQARSIYPEMREDGDSKKAMDILFGWVVGHGRWAAFSRRYNLQTIQESDTLNPAKLKPKKIKSNL
jgi:hypothetical protein